MNLRDFYAENLGIETIDLVAEALDDKKLRANVTSVPHWSTQPLRGGRSSVIGIPGTNLPS